MSVLRFIIRKAWTYLDMINHLQDFGHIKTERSIVRMTWHIKTPINHRKSLAYPYSNYQTQDLSISIKTRLIIHKTWVCHKVLVKYILHLYCLAVQVGFYSDMVECWTLDRRVPGSILIRGMEIFLRVCDRCIRTLINHSQVLIGHVKTLINRSEDLGISRLQSIVASHWHIRTPINH